MADDVDDDDDDGGEKTVRVDGPAMFISLQGGPKKTLLTSVQSQAKKNY